MSKFWDPWGCPVCGTRHRPGTLQGLSGMNKRCLDKFNRMPKEKQAIIIEKWQKGVKGQ